MNILGIDYGRNKIGVAIGIGSLAEPLEVIRYKDTSEAVSNIRRIVEREDIKKIIIGISEGTMALESKNFGKVLQKNFGVPVEYSDETLTSKEAQSLAIEAGIKRKKRKEMEDAFAAALMLQFYLDSIGYPS